MNKIGDILRHWRQVRRMSQMDLALETDVSTKHLSFVETGRAQPSRELVLKLSHSLNLPLRAQNAFLLASGFAPQFSEMPLAMAQMEIIQDTLQRIVSNHEPYPALVVNSTYDILLSNQKFKEIMGWYVGVETVEKYPNIYRLMFAADGLRPYIKNWPFIQTILLARLWGEAASSQDATLQNLYEELSPSLANAPEKTPHLPESDLPVLDLTLQKETLQLRFFSTITTFGTPLDVTVQGLRIDCMFPADAETKQLLTA